MKTFAVGVVWIAGLLVAFPTHANVYTCHTLCDVKWLAEVEIAELRYVLVGEAQNEINGRDDFDWTPLHLASRWSRAEVIEALIHAGAELDAITDFTGQAQIHSAVASGRVENMETLILAGASVEARCLKGGTPLHWARPSMDQSRSCVNSLMLAQCWRPVIERDTPLCTGRRKKEQPTSFVC